MINWLEHCEHWKQPPVWSVGQFVGVYHECQSDTLFNHWRLLPVFNLSRWNRAQLRPRLGMHAKVRSNDARPGSYMQTFRKRFVWCHSVCYCTVQRLHFSQWSVPTVSILYKLSFVIRVVHVKETLDPHGNSTTRYLHLYCNVSRSGTRLPSVDTTVCSCFLSVHLWTWIVAIILAYQLVYYGWYTMSFCRGNNYHNCIACSATRLCAFRRPYSSPK